MSAPDDSPIEHVSDTALWVASFREQESARPDAVFRDPLVGTLLGERGRKVAAAMPHGKMMGWVMVSRTVAIDRLIQEAVGLGVDTVLNLGAGLDTRPYRLPLPASLRWIEVDFPGPIARKEQILASHRPACRLERIGLDLGDAAARRPLFAKVGAESRACVILTEGVLPYLTNAQVGELADDLSGQPSFRYWIQDYYLGNFTRRLPPGLARRLKATPFRFRVEDWFAFFAAHGWRRRTDIKLIDQARALRRPPPFVFPWTLLAWLLPPAARRRYEQANGYVMLERAG